jgi:hypothetical protein
MLGAPPGFIPMPNGDIINVRSIDSVCKPTFTTSTSFYPSWMEEIPSINFNKPVVCVECRGVKWFLNMSVQQFAARMVEAMSETNGE